MNVISLGTAFTKIVITIINSIVIIIILLFFKYVPPFSYIFSNIISSSNIIHLQNQLQIYYNIYLKKYKGKNKKFT